MNRENAFIFHPSSFILVKIATNYLFT